MSAHTPGGPLEFRKKYEGIPWAKLPRAERMRREKEARDNDSPLVSCPWCGKAIKSQPAYLHIGHLIECGDRLIAAAPALLEACKDMLKAADELMTEYVSKKRAANWGVINQAMVDASAAIRAAKGETV